VVAPGLALAGEHPSRKMLVAAWTRLDEVLQAPGTDPEAAEILLPDRAHLWGASLLFTGKRYGPEINGTRESGWGEGQNRDFQLTAPFITLRTPGNLDRAAMLAIEEARSDPHMAEALPADTSPTQVKWWAAEVLEIAVLDYLLRQQDRVGNIDYQWRWLWLQGGEVRSQPASGTPPHPEARRLRVSWLNDNDAGIRSGYVNYADRTGMLEGLRHFDPQLYRRLRALAADFATRGPLYQAVASNYHLRTRELEGIARRAAALDQLISRDCRAGHYRFDLTPADLLGAAAETPEPIPCD
jgi:hypothetical protein